MYSRKRSVRAWVLCVGLAGSATWAAVIATAFTYQGYLEKPSGTPVTGVTCDFRVGLWDAVALFAGPQTVGATVDDGVFTIVLDYGANAIDGTARWLAIEVQGCSPSLWRCRSGGSGSTLPNTHRLHENGFQ
jgi:hypothetical protein